MIRKILVAVPAVVVVCQMDVVGAAVSGAVVGAAPVIPTDATKVPHYSQDLPRADSLYLKGRVANE